MTELIKIQIHTNRFRCVYTSGRRRVPVRHAPLFALVFQLPRQLKPVAFLLGLRRLGKVAAVSELGQRHARFPGRVLQGSATATLVLWNGFQVHRVFVSRESHSTRLPGDARQVIGVATGEAEGDWVSSADPTLRIVP